MLMTKYFLIGNMSIPSTWVAIIIAFVLTYIGIRLKFGKYIADLLSDLLFYFIIVWKLSVILTDFKTVIHSPLSILYFHGGSVGVFLGIFAVILKIFIEIKKKNLSRTNLIPLFVGSVLIQAIYQVLMALLNEGTMVVQITTIIGFILFSLFIWLSVKHMNDLGSVLALLFIVVHLFISSLQPVGIFGIPVLTTVIIGGFFTIVLSKRFS